MIIYKPWQFFSFIAIVIIVAFLSIPSSEKLGQIYFDSYQYDKALVYFNKVNSLEENNIPTLKKLKEYFLIQGAVPDALEVQKKLVFLRPKNVTYLEELEQLYDWNQQPILKINTMKKRADLLPTLQRIELYEDMLSGLRWLRNYDEADQLARFIQIDSELKKDINLNEIVIEYYLATKKSDEAIYLLALNVIKNPNDTRSIERVAEAYRFEKNYEESIHFYQRLMGISENDIGSIDNVAKNVSKLSTLKIVQNLGTVELIIDGLLKMSRPEIVMNVRKVLIKALPDDPNLKFVLIDSYLKNNMTGEAIKLLKGFEFESLKYSSAIYEAASLLNDIGKPELAVKLMERLVERYPNQSSYLEFLGDLYEKIGLKEKAINIYFKILELKRRSMIHSVPLFLTALNESNGRNLPIIPKNYSLKSNSIFRQDKQVTRIRQKVLYLIDEMESFDKRSELLKKLLQDKPNDKQVLTRLGYLYFANGQSEEAYRYFDMAYIVSPNDTNILEVLVRRDIEEKKWDNAQFKMSKLKNSDSYVDLNEEFLYQTESIEHEKICKQIALKSELKRVEQEVLSRCYFRSGKYKQSLDLINVLIEDEPKEIRYQFLALSSCLELKDVNCSDQKMMLLANDLKVSEAELKPYNEYLNEVKAELRRLNAWSMRTTFDVLVYQSWTVYSEELELGRRWNSWGLVFDSSYTHFAQYDESKIKNFTLKGKYFSDDFQISAGTHFYKGVTSHMSPYFDLNVTKNFYFLSLSISKDREAVSNRDLVVNNVRSHQIEVYAEERVSKRLTSTQFGSIFQVESSEEIGNGYQLKTDVLYKLWGNLPLWSGAILGHSRGSAKNGVSLFSNNYFDKSSPYGVAFTKKESTLVNNFSFFDWDARLEILGDFDRELSFARILNAFARVKYHYNYNKFLEVSSSWGQEATADIKGDAWEFKLSWNHWW